MSIVQPDTLPQKSVVTLLDGEMAFKYYDGKWYSLTDGSEVQDLRIAVEGTLGVYDVDTRRPATEHRWTTGERQEPGVIRARSHWLYSPRSPDSASTKPFWAFSRGADVVESDWPPPYSVHDLASHIERAVSSFGDDKDIVIEVRLARPEEVD